MDEAKRLKIFDLKTRIGELHAEIKGLEEGCGSWFQPDDARTGPFQCGHGFGNCPGCVKKASEGAGEMSQERKATGISIGGVPVTGFAGGEEVISVPRNEKDCL